MVRWVFQSTGFAEEVVHLQDRVICRISAADRKFAGSTLHVQPFAGFFKAGGGYQPGQCYFQFLFVHPKLFSGLSILICSRVSPLLIFAAG